jgi:hypothetical protein
MQDIKIRILQTGRSWGIWITGALALGILITMLAGPSIRSVYAAQWQGVRTFVAGGVVTQPDVKVDNAGYVHLIWISDLDRLRYLRGQLVNGGRDIVWDGGTAVDLAAIAGNTKVKESVEQSRTPRVVVDDRGVVHVVYLGEGGRILYLFNGQRGAPGAWGALQVANAGDASATFALSMALDSAYTPYVAWAEGLGGNSSRLRYSYLGDGGFTGPVIISPGYDLIKTSGLAVSGSGNNARIHAAYWIQDNGDKAEYSVISRSGGAYAATRFSGLTGHGSDPFLVYDQATDTLFLNFIARAGDRGFNFLFGRKPASESGWNPNFLSDRLDPNNTDLAPGFSPMAVLGDTVHIATEYKFSGASQLEIYYRTYQISTQSLSPWTRISDQSVSFETKSNAPSIGAYGGVVSAWVTGNTQNVKGNVAPNSAEPVPTATPTVTPSPTPVPNPVIQQMTVLGTQGAGKTTSTTVDVRLDVQNGTPPYRYQLSNDGVNFTPAEPAPLVDPIGWELVDAGPSNACSNRVVYARVYDAVNRVSETVQSQIVLDPGVDVNVKIQNPFLPSSQQTFVTDFPGNGNGASNGDPNYTRAFFYYGQVQVLSGECSGLAAALFGQMEPLSLTSTGVAETIPLTLPPGVTQENAEDTEYSIGVQVQDGVGNQDVYAETIILDRSNPVINNATTDPGSLLTITDKQGATITETNSVVVNLSVSGIDVTDATYGERAAVPLWGVWLANSETNIDPSDTTALNQLDWLPTKVPHEQVSEAGGLYSFTLSGWSVVGGITDPDLSAGSDYYVYARVLDGAGNPSDEVIRSGPITFSQDVTLPTIYMPNMHR